MNANIQNFLGEAVSIAATIPLAGAFLLSAAGLGLAKTIIAPVSKTAAAKVSAAASAPWNKLIAE